MDVASGNLIGTLLRVLNHDEENGRVYVRLQDGRSGSFAPEHGLTLARGDVLLVDEYGIPEPAPSDLWTEPNGVGVIRHIDDEGYALVDTGEKILRVLNLRELPVTINNTVEYNDIEGLLGVLSETPVRSRDLGLDQAEILSEYLVKKSDTPLSFADFGGYPEVIARAQELIQTQFEHRERLEKIGAKPLKGILFTGPPGTGKTHLARIIADVSKADFFLVSGPSIVSKWVGDTESTLRRLFQAATASQSGRAIIFFDEIDSIAERRSATAHEFSNRLVAQLLTLLDGFEDGGKSVVVIAATNRVETLDPALTRSGRFDWEIEFNHPTLSDRLDILRVGAQHLRTAGELAIEDIALLTDGWSAAEITSLWGEAALITARDRRDAITSEDLVLAHERVAARPRRDGGQGATS